LQNFYYKSSISKFLISSTNEILGILHDNSPYKVEKEQTETWKYQINILKEKLIGFYGTVLFEFTVPRMGCRIDVILIIKNVLFVIEFKHGTEKYNLNAIEQVWDYALDLKNFHKTSHSINIAPILIATEAKTSYEIISKNKHNDNLLLPIKTNPKNLNLIITAVLDYSVGKNINSQKWLLGNYYPTPSIIEAAKALYNNHNVTDITRNDAKRKNLSKTSTAIFDIINKSKKRGYKSICFVTGVPGAGKTLVGLNVATKQMDLKKSKKSIYLSGNGPLVNILREALTRDKWARENDLRKKHNIKKLKKGEVLNEVKAIIQNVHNYRDAYIKDKRNPPYDHVAIFDEAQRAWTKEKTADFMKRRKKIRNFKLSEPEFLISCLNRHKDWAVVICLVGGGQEIYSGEAGISEWIKALYRSYPEWRIYISDKLTDSEYSTGEALDLLKKHKSVLYKKDLHLSVSLRSFRAENQSLLVKNLLDLKIVDARKNFMKLKDKYPIVITRDLRKAKKWLKDRARGSERYGIVISSQAERLKPHALDVKSPIDPIHWFLDGKEDIRSSFYLEDVATEFHVQGLELDWACVVWDGDFRYSPDGWQNYSFKGSKWQNVNKEERKHYLKNAYRVLLTRARQGMVIVVPNGDNEDPTRNSKYYDPTYNYLVSIGFKVL